MVTASIPGQSKWRWCRNCACKTLRERSIEAGICAVCGKPYSWEIVRRPITIDVRALAMGEKP